MASPPPINQIEDHEDVTRVGAIEAGPDASRPGSPSDLILYLSDDLGRADLWNGSKYIPIGLSESEISLANLGSNAHSGLSTAPTDAHHNRDHDHTETGISSVPNSGLVNSSVTLASTNVSLGGSATFGLSDLSDLDAGNSPITNVADPSNAQEVATKAYADNISQGVVAKEAVRLSSTGQWSSADSFSGGTITNVSTGATGGGGGPAVDGTEVSVGDRLLAKDGIDEGSTDDPGVYNGIWIVEAVDTTNGDMDLSRAPDMDEDSEVSGGEYVWAEQGTNNGDKGYLVISDNPTLNTDIINWTQFSGAGQITADPPLTKSGDTLGLNDAGIDGDVVDIDFTPSNYSPDDSNSESADVDDLSAHLNGIDGAISGAGGGLTWNVITSDTTATAGNGYACDVSGSALTLTLPSGPSEGDQVAVVDFYSNSETNNITVDRNGENIEGSASNLTVDVNGAGFTLVYTDATRGWEIVSEIGTKKPDLAGYIEPGALTISNNSTDTDHDIDVTGGEVAVHDFSGSWSVVDMPDETPAFQIDTTGDDGLINSSSLSADTWYELGVIADSSGSNSPSVVGYTDANRPTASSDLPSGFDLFRAMGTPGRTWWVRTNGSSNIRAFNHYADGWLEWAESELGNFSRLLNTTSAPTSNSTVDASSQMPPGTYQIKINRLAATESDGSGNAAIGISGESLTNWENGQATLVVEQGGGSFAYQPSLVGVSAQTLNYITTGDADTIVISKIGSFKAIT